MCPTLNVRLPDHLKRGMEQLRNRVNWNEEIRQFIRRRVVVVERRALFTKLQCCINDLPKAPPGYRDPAGAGRP